MNCSISLIITAAGLGKRVNAGINKTLLKISNRTVLEINLRSFLKHPEIKEILISYTEIDFLEYQEIISYIDMKTLPKIKLVKGGKERHHSVLNCLKQVDQDSDYIMIHDGARPFLLSEIFDNFLSEIEEKKEAIIPYLDSQDTTIYVHKNKMKLPLYLEQNSLSRIDRSLLLKIQTPQCFSMRLANKLIDILDNEESTYTDESTALLNTKEKILFIRGSKYLNKITDMEDFEIASSLYQVYLEKEANYENQLK